MSLLAIFLYVVAAVGSFCATRGLIAYCHAHELLDHPKGRKSHLAPTPFLGGLGIFFVFWTVLALTSLSGLLLDRHGIVLFPTLSDLPNLQALIPKISRIMIGGVIIMVIGVLDDIHQLKPIHKFAGQLLAAGILISGDLTIGFLNFLGPIAILVTVVWVIVLMNAFNFIDSIDGHCTAIGLISSLVFFWISMIVEQQLVGIMVIVFAGCLTGFFVNNFPKAKIFLGDNGSMTIGYLMAAITLICDYGSAEPLSMSFLVPLFLFGVPLYDSISVVIVRIVRGQKPWEGDRNHFAHRLMRLGMKANIAVFFSSLVAIAFGIVALMCTQTVTPLGVFLNFLMFAVMMGIIATLEYYSAKQSGRVVRLKKMIRD